MKKPNEIQRGVFTATVKNLRFDKYRYILILQISEINIEENIEIDIYDSVYEITGMSTLNKVLKSRILSNLPSTIKISNVNGYWKIQNEAQILSNTIAKSL